MTPDDDPMQPEYDFSKGKRGAVLSPSQIRFHKRIERFRQRGIPVVYHHFWWLTHNAVAHPLIAILPIKPLFDFHDYTSGKINGK